MSSAAQQPEPVAIIGIGCRYPGADDPGAFWKTIRDGIDTITEVPKSRWSIEQYYDLDPIKPDKTNTRWGGFLDQIDRFDPQFFGIAPREVYSMDPQQRLLLEVAWESLEDAGQVPKQLRGTRTGTFIGVGTHDYSILLWQKPVNDPYATVGTGNCIAANRISYIFDFKGPSLAVDTACSSSLVAIHLACQSLWSGESSMALAGGVNALILPTIMAGFSKGGFLAGDGRCKSFDAKADGYVRSEGAGIVVLKPLTQALADNDPIYAVIRGSAVNQDGCTQGLAAPNPKTQEMVLREAYRRAGVSPDQVQYVEAHGTGTKLGDPVEMQALGAVLSENRHPSNYCAVGSVKTNIGHSETAAGVAGLIKTALALKHGQIPPSLHFNSPNPQIDFERLLLRVKKTLAPWPERSTPALAGVNSFGFGGTNAHVVLEAAPHREDMPQQKEYSAHLLTLSAKSGKALRELAQRYVAFLNNRTDISVADVCLSANTRRSHFHHRLACVAKSKDQLRGQLQAFAAGEEAVGTTQGAVANDTSPSIAFLFTGQGSQYIGMGEELYHTQPLFRETLNHCDAILQPYLPTPLLEVIYPSPKQTLGSNGTERKASWLNQTTYTQPALFAVEYALAQMWISWGIQPSVVMGHSVGEYVAACVAGVFRLEEGLKLIAARGRLMQALPQTGTMLAVRASEEQVRQAIAPYQQDVAIAAINAPQNIVISGRQTAVATLRASLEAAGIEATPLNVSHAFHSPLMEPMLAEFAQTAAEIDYRPPQLPIGSNVTGGLVTEEMTTPDYWCQHIRQPVRFADTLNTLYQQGHRTFLEIGPKPILLGMGRACLPQPENRWLPSLRSGYSDWQCLLQSLGELYTQGTPVNWSGIEPKHSRPFVHLPTYPFQRQRYWWEEAPIPSSTPHTPTVNQYSLLGKRLRLAGTSEIRFESQVSSHTPAYLADHCLLAQPVFPAAAYVEMTLTAGEQVFESSRVTVSQLAIEEPLLLAEAATTIQLVLYPTDGKPEYSFQIFSLVEGEEQGEQVARHASGVIAPLDCKPSPSPNDLTELQAAFMPHPVSVADYYQTLRDRGFHYGSRFRGIHQLWQGEGQALSQIKLPDTESLKPDGAQLHPVLLDSCFQTLGAAVVGDAQQGTYLPVGFDHLHLYTCPRDRVWCHVRVRPGEVQGESSSLLKADLDLWDETGAITAQLEGVSLQFTSHSSLEQLLNPKEAREDWLYEVVWQPQERESDNMPSEISSWLIFADQHGVGNKLAERLRERGDHAILVFPAQTDKMLETDCYAVNPTQLETFQQLLAELQATHCGIVHFWGLDATTSSSTDWQTAQSHSCGSVLHLVQAITQAQWSIPPRLWLITRETHAIDASSLPQLQQAPLWGLASTIRLEHPELHCTCLDWDSFTETTDWQALLEELCSPDDEEQVAYRQGIRHVARLVPQQTARNEGRLPIPNAESFRLSLSSYGILDGLTLVPASRQSPQPGEVEIRVRASGVNFRDVLNALGMLQSISEEMGFADATEIPFGGECAGIVTAVGEGVAGLEVGDEVIAAQAVGSLGQFVTVNASFVVAKPQSLNFAEAATVPTTFLTAYYGLHELAKLEAGDRVLIHAAAGGVGQAAVQLAQQSGAEVFATASPGKWEFLRSLGVKHVMNSRTLHFADEVLALTDGQGVDVVFNSLNGEFIPKNLEVLASQGRWVEIGKIGIWEESHIHQVRADVAYFPFDLLEISQAHPDRIARMLAELMPQFQQCSLTPLRYTVFPIQEVASAFQYMAQAKHIGKVVISLTDIPKQCPLVERDASYLIVGGLGALGLQMARWLVEQGAKHLVLCGRKEASPTAQETIHQLGTAGASVRVVQVDVSDAAEVGQMLEPYQSAHSASGSSTATLPPIRGIIHAAGVLDDGILQKQSWERFSQVMAPKVAGAWNLHRLSQNLSLDFFVCFSSVASLLGSPGQGSYAAANAFLDALAHYRRQLGLPGLSINWGPWAGGGMAAGLDQPTQERWAAQGLTAIAPEQGLQILEDLLRQGCSQVGVLPIDQSLFFQTVSPGQVSPFLERVTQAETPTQRPPEFRQQLETVSEGERLQLLHELICTQLAKVLGFGSPEYIDSQENFSDLGMDSLMAVELINCLQVNLGCSIPQTLLLDYPTTDALATYLANQVFEGEWDMPSEVRDNTPPQEDDQATIAASPSDYASQPIPSDQELPAEFHQFHLTPEYLNLRQDLDRAEKLGNPFFTVHEGTARDTTQIEGQDVWNYSSYNYLGFSGDSRVSQAAKAAIDEYGTSVSASRVVSGERPIHRQLEEAIATFLGTEDCIAYVGGHATNVSTIGHLFRERDLILYDALSHNSIREGCKLSQATAIEFPHNDWQMLDRLLQEHRLHYQKALVVIEGIYSTDGDLAPLPEIVAVKKRHKAFVMVDEAHSIGTLGNRGRGIGEHYGILASEVDLWMGTLSKSLASCGGYIAGCKALVEYLKYTAPGFVFSVGISPTNAASALAALRLLNAEPERVTCLQARSRLFLDLAQSKGFNTGSSKDSPIIPIIVGEPDETVQLSHALFRQGINIQPMVYPSVPYHAARLRFFISSTHTEQQILQTMSVLAAEMPNIQMGRNSQASG